MTAAVDGMEEDIQRERERKKRQEFTCGSLDAYYFQLNINHDINQH